MAQSQGYKRFLLSMNANHYYTSTPQGHKTKHFPRHLSSKPIIHINRITVIQKQKSCHCKKQILENLFGIF
ncbi:hypothetical protein I4U23_000310 [Adineta vaga]|nr:hypothetical protein I4U23_000310 [Adineta vaga]